MTIEVLEVDQWSSTADNLREMSLADFKEGKGFDNLKGGDSEAIKSLRLGSYKIITVEEDWTPDIGDVWFREDPETGKLKYWKARYDSS